MKLKDRVALITGGSSGIGRAAAVLMAQQGAKVAITARRAERCAEAVEAIEKNGGEAIALPGPPPFRPSALRPINRSYE